MNKWRITGKLLTDVTNKVWAWVRWFRVGLLPCPVSRGSITNTHLYWLISAKPEGYCLLLRKAGQSFRAIQMV